MKITFHEIDTVTGPTFDVYEHGKYRGNFRRSVGTGTERERWATGLPPAPVEMSRRLRNRLDAPVFATGIREAMGQIEGLLLASALHGGRA